MIYRDSIVWRKTYGEKMKKKNNENVITPASTPQLQDQRPRSGLKELSRCQINAVRKRNFHHNSSAWFVRK